MAYSVRLFAEYVTVFCVLNLKFVLKIVFNSFQCYAAFSFVDQLDSFMSLCEIYTSLTGVLSMLRKQFLTSLMFTGCHVVFAWSCL